MAHESAFLYWPTLQLAFVLHDKMSVLYVTQACSERELISTFRSTNESIAYTEKRSKTIV